MLSNPLKALLIREIRRFMRIWIQTIVPPVITTSLYFIIFGELIGNRIGDFQGRSYSEFIAPGLILMALISNSYANSVSSFFSAKLQRYLEELVVAPVSTATLLVSFLLGGIARGFIVGLVVFATASLFVGIQIEHIGSAVLVALITSLLFSALGLINGIYANTFDATTIIPSFVLTPLIYLGGIFFSITMLPSPWDIIATYNPIFYAINSFRFALLGSADVSFMVSLATLSISASIATLICYYLLNKNIGTNL